MSAYGNLRRIKEALEYLAGFAQSQLTTLQEGVEPGFEQLVDAYVKTHRTVADEFEALSRDVLVSGDSLLEETRLATERRMKQLFSGKVPDQYLRARRYGGVHPVLLEYLARHVGEPVPASKLRVLTGDQVHTERRVRALRDYGFSISWKHVSGEAQYVLSSTSGDLDVAARFQLRKNLQDDRSLSSEEKARFLKP